MTQHGDALAGLFAAVRAGDADAVAAAVRARPDLLAARDARGLSPVMWACYARQGGALAALLAAGAPLDAFEAAAAGDLARLEAHLVADPGAAQAWSADGFTALHLAAFFAHAPLAARLLAAGADARAAARNDSRVTPLHSAAAAGATAIVGALLAAGADPDARQAGGYTALMAAAQQGRDELAAVLLAHGADRDARAADGRAAADFADQERHHALAARLRGGPASA